MKEKLVSFARRRGGSMAIATLAAVLGGVVVFTLWRVVSAPSEQAEPQPPVTEPVVLFWGTGAPEVEQVEVSQSCAELVEGLRDVMADNAFAANMDLAEAEAFNQALSDVTSQPGCSTEELDAILESEVRPFQEAIPPTFTSENPADLSRKCSQALSPLRQRLAELDAGSGDATTLLGEVTDVTTQAQTEGACSRTEVTVFTATEVAPVARRVGVAETGQAVVNRAGDLDVALTKLSDLELSTGCERALAQLVPAIADEDTRADAVGTTAQLVADGDCTQKEVDAFALEVIPELLGSPR